MSQINGSHHIFTHPELPGIVNIQNKKGQVHPYQVRHKTTSIQDKIPYDVAIEYLIQSIKLLLDQGKAAVISSVNNLMYKNQEIFPNYQGVSSILKPDGKTFSKFGKFVDAVIKDGKIRKQNQELFLIEVDKLVA